MEIFMRIIQFIQKQYGYPNNGKISLFFRAQVILQKNNNFWKSQRGHQDEDQHTYLARRSTVIMKAVPLG